MTKPDDTIRILIPLKVRKKNRRDDRLQTRLPFNG